MIEKKFEVKITSNKQNFLEKRTTERSVEVFRFTFVQKKLFVEFCVFVCSVFDLQTFYFRNSAIGHISTQVSKQFNYTERLSDIMKPNPNSNNRVSSRVIHF